MQNRRPLSTYYNELVEIFQEIDHRTNMQDESIQGILQMHSMMARLRVHIFFNELDANLIKFVERFYERTQSLILKVHMLMSEEKLNRARLWEVLS